MASFSVTATGAQPLDYQWQLNGRPFGRNEFQLHNHQCRRDQRRRLFGHCQQRLRKSDELQRQPIRL